MVELLKRCDKAPPGEASRARRAMTGNALCVVCALRSVLDAVLVGGTRDSPLGVGPGRPTLPLDPRRGEFSMGASVPGPAMAGPRLFAQTQTFLVRHVRGATQHRAR
jgi:hypothetical protein